MSSSEKSDLPRYPFGCYGQLAAGQEAIEQIPGSWSSVVNVWLDIYAEYHTRNRTC